MPESHALVDALREADSLLVVCHDDPDPDCIASALALKRIAEVRGVDDVQITYGGRISHQQNRAFVNLFDIEMEPFDELESTGYDRIAMVDNAIPGTHNRLPPDAQVDVVIDHHPGPKPESPRFVDVREGIGATTTILVEYVRDLDVELTNRLTTALLFALHRECLDFVRRPAQADYDAARWLYPHVDPDVLRQLYGASFTSATVDVIGDAIKNRETRGSSLVSCVGRTSERDALVQAADYLLNLEGVDTVLVSGFVEDHIQVSARSVDPRIDLGGVLQDAFGDVGSAGGHEDMAGAQIPLGIFGDVTDDDDLVEFAERRVSGRFFEAMRLEKDEETEE